MPTLHGTSLSPFARKVLVALAEKEVTFEHESVFHFALPDGFEQRHPLRQIPVWTTDQGDDIPDSSVIVAYLDRMHPEVRLVPEDPLLAARALFAEEFMDGALTPAIATIFLERFAAPIAMGRPTDEDLVQKVLAKRIPPLFAHLDAMIGERAFVVGDAFTVGDCAVSSSLCNLRHTGIEIDGSAYPNLRRYADAMIERPTIAKIFAAEVAQYGGSSPEAAAASAA